MPTELNGLQKQMSQLQAIAYKIPGAIGDKLINKTLVIARESYQEVPVDIGKLRGSQEIEGPIVEENRISTIISYSTVYALRQHQEMGYRHTVGKARYLSDPIERRVPEMGFMVADAFQMVFREEGLK